ncbi:MAG: hypothetical protein WC004_03930 [Candidatus Absconditabacterales bacterium]
MLQHINEFFDRGIGRQCKRIGKGLLVMDLILVLSGHIYHHAKPSTHDAKQKLAADIAALHNRVTPHIAKYSSLISDFLNKQNADQGNALQDCFPDALSFHCFAKLIQDAKQSHNVSSHYYGYLLGLYTELGAPKLDTTRCLLNRLWLDCAHADISSVCFHGGPVSESVFIAELSHHVQFEKDGWHSILAMILDLARIYHDPTRWYNKLVHNVGIYRTLYNEPGNLEFEAHTVIESSLRQGLFAMVAQKLSTDLVYLEEAKSDIRSHAQAIAAIAGGTLDSKKTGQGALMGTRSLEQIYTKYRFVAYLPKDHPFRMYLSDELKRFYLRHLYFVCNSQDPNHRYLFMGSILPLIEFSSFFNLTVIEQQELSNALKHLASHLQ